MPASNTIVLKSLSILLGLFFIFVGLLKLTPAISKDLFKDLVRIAENLVKALLYFPQLCILIIVYR